MLSRDCAGVSGVDEAELGRLATVGGQTCSSRCLLLVHLRWWLIASLAGCVAAVGLLQWLAGSALLSWMPPMDSTSNVEMTYLWYIRVFCDARRLALLVTGLNHERIADSLSFVQEGAQTTMALHQSSEAGRAGCLCNVRADASHKEAVR
jgi:hypothetical protein